jgi:hypothetical protein
MVSTDADVEREVDGEPPRRHIVISGPSGVGKGLIIEQIPYQLDRRVGLSVSHTWREPRSGEREGLHYYLRSREEMETEIGGGGFLEYSKKPPCSAWLLHASCHRLRPTHLVAKVRQFRAPHVLLSCRMLFWCGTTASPLQDWAPWLGSRYARQPGLHHGSPFFRDAQHRNQWGSRLGNIRYARQPGLHHGSPFFRHAKSKPLVHEALTY